MTLWKIRNLWIKSQYIDGIGLNKNFLPEDLCILKSQPTLSVNLSLLVKGRKKPVSPQT